MNGKHPKVFVVGGEETNLRGWLIGAGYEVVTAPVSGRELLDSAELEGVLDGAAGANMIVGLVPSGVKDKRKVADWCALVMGLGKTVGVPWLIVAPVENREQLDQGLGDPWVTGEATTVYSSHRPVGWRLMESHQRDSAQDHVLASELSPKEFIDPVNRRALVTVQAASEMLNWEPTDSSWEFELDDAQADDKAPEG